MVAMGVIPTPCQARCSVPFLVGAEHGDSVSLVPCGQSTEATLTSQPSNESLFCPQSLTE